MVWLPDLSRTQPQNQWRQDNQTRNYLDEANITNRTWSSWMRSNRLIKSGCRPFILEPL